jgi:hypothetical protein
MLAALMLVGLAAVPAPVGAATQAMVPACSGVNLRAAATTGATARARLATTARVTVAATVSGSSWRTDCAGPKAGSSWHRISHVNGATVRSLYGVTYLYAASGLLKTAPSAAPRPPAPPVATPAPAPPTPAPPVAPVPAAVPADPAISTADPYGA